MTNRRFVRTVFATLAATAVAGVSLARLSEPQGPPTELDSYYYDAGYQVFLIACSGASYNAPGDLASCQACCDGSSIVQSSWWARYACFTACWSTFIPIYAEP